jgi:hypothetical protein
MARTRINSKSKDLLSDNGSVLVSVIDGEQIHLDITLNWLTSLSGFTIVCKIVEADSSNLNWLEEEMPLTEVAGGVITNLVILDTDPTDNTFKIVIPESLVNAYATQPLPHKPSFGWIGLEIADTGTGSAQQIWKPLRGLVEILYSPTEQV